ncbi:MAG: hypothetical protein ACTSRA_12095 [Promethearchaeota archaeon]
MLKLNFIKGDVKIQIYDAHLEQLKNELKKLEEIKVPTVQERRQMMELRNKIESITRKCNKNKHGQSLFDRHRSDVEVELSLINEAKVLLSKGGTIDEFMDLRQRIENIPILSLKLVSLLRKINFKIQELI